MIGLFKALWAFTKGFATFCKQLLGFTGELINEFAEVTEALNHEMSIKAARSKVQLYYQITRKHKNKIPAKYISLTIYIEELDLLFVTLLELLEEVEKDSSVHSTCNEMIESLSKEFKLAIESPEFKLIKRYCKNKGYTGPSNHKLIECYLDLKSYEELEKELNDEKGVLFDTRKALKGIEQLKVALFPDAETKVAKNKKATNQLIKPKLEGEKPREESHEKDVSSTLSTENIPLSDIVFITKSNESKILSNLDLKGDKADFECLYDESLSFILSTPELNLLHVYKRLCAHPKEALAAYKKVNKKDTKQFVWEGGKPAFHFKSDCPRLNSEFTNITIPVEIQDKGDLEISRFRDFVKEYRCLLEEDEVRFMHKLEARFLLKNPPKSIKYLNSGVQEFCNLNLLDLKYQIDSLLIKASKFRDSDEEISKLISVKGYGTHKVKEAKDKSSPLYEWHAMKSELKDLLKQYYRVKFNPELKFDKTLLEQVGFQPCRECDKSHQT